MYGKQKGSVKHPGSDPGPGKNIDSGFKK